MSDMPAAVLTVHVNQMSLGECILLLAAGSITSGAFNAHRVWLVQTSHLRMQHQQDYRSSSTREFILV